MDRDETPIPEAHCPDDNPGLSVSEPKRVAGGLPAAFSSLKHVLGTAGVARGTRALAERNGGAKRYLNFGASPRASLALYQAGRALAWLRGQDYLSPSLVQELAPDILRHRIGLTYEAEAEEITPDKIVAQVVERTPVPAK